MTESDFGKPSHRLCKEDEIEKEVYFFTHSAFIQL